MFVNSSTTVMNPIKVVMTSIGRFHFFDLARELQGMGYLERLFTGYPRWKVDDDLRDKTSCFPWLVTPQMALYRFGLQSVGDLLNQPATEMFDRWVGERLPECDVFMGMSQSGLQTIRTAKARGIKTICERGSAHIVTQNEILIEEYARHKVAFQGIPKWVIERELQEYNEADMIKVLSTFAYNSFLEQGVSENRLTVIPLGVDLNLFRPVAKEDNVFRVLYAGAMSLQKGLPYLLQAVSVLKLPDFETVLVGSMQNEVRSAFAAYSGAYRYNGVTPRSKLHWQYSQASVFILPSVQDGFGAVMAQAMACGVPVIATTNTGASDLFTDGVEGFIVPIRDAQAIHERIVYLYENPEVRRQMGEAALKRVQSFGGWNEHAQHTVQLLQKLLAQ